MCLILIALVGVGLGACAGASPGSDNADTASERGDRTREAAQGDRSAQTKPEAMNQAGNESEAKAAYASGDYIRAMPWYRKAAEQGNARCADQAGVDVSIWYLAHAVALYRKACEGGVLASCSNLGVMYDNGFGVPRYIFEAVVLYRKPVTAGSQLAVSILGQGMNVESVSTRTSEKRSSTMDERVI